MPETLVVTRPPTYNDPLSATTISTVSAKNVKRRENCTSFTFRIQVALGCFTVTFPSGLCPIVAHCRTQEPSLSFKPARWVEQL